MKAIHPILLWLLVLIAPPVQTQEDTVPVAVEQAEIAPVIEEVPVIGTVTSPRSARLSTAVGGLVETVHVEAGDRVEAGTLLVTIDPELAQHELARLAAAIQQARVELADARRRLREAESLRGRLSIAETEVESRRYAVDAVEATLAQRQAEAALQRARLDRHTVEASFAGVISRKHTAEGEWVEPGTVLLELVDLAHLRIDFAVPQDVFLRVTPDTPIQVRPAGHPELVAGRIQRIVPVTDPQARNFLVHAVPQDTTAMTPGMSAQGLLRLTTEREAVVIPRDALIRYPNGRTTVWVLDQEAKPPVARERRIETGKTFNQRIVIRDGLQAGETVVVRGNTRLQEGQRVRIQP